MDFNMPPEMVNAPVKYGDLAKIFECLSSMSETSGDAHYKSMECTLNLISVSIKNAEYKRIRDVRYFIETICAHNLLDRKKMYKHYVDWCDEYDKLNKGDKNES